MKSTLRTLALVLAAAVLPLAAQGFRHGRGPGGGPGMGHGPMFACLNLTDAQKASLKTIREKYRPGFETGRAAAMKAQQALRTAMANPATTDADLKALYDQASAARFGMLQQRRAMLQESLAVLTPDQKAQWEAMREKTQQRMQHRRFGQGMGPGAGPAPAPDAQ